MRIARFFFVNFLKFKFILFLSVTYWEVMLLFFNSSNLLLFLNTCKKCLGMWCLMWQKGRMLLFFCFYYVFIRLPILMVPYMLVLCCLSVLFLLHFFNLTAFEVIMPWKKQQQNGIYFVVCVSCKICYL